MVISEIIESSDNMAVKYLMRTDDLHYVEATYVDYPNKHIICYSTQIGCHNQCKFCYNGIHPGFVRNLSSGEMINECLYIMANRLGGRHPGEERKPILFSAMGIGDPLDNYDNYITSINYLNTICTEDKIRFAMSTCASEPDKIRSLIKSTEGLDFKLQISLHSPFPDQRHELMPHAGHMRSTLMACDDYINHTNNRDIEFNIILMDGVNDDLEHAEALATLFNTYFKGYVVRSHVRIKINKFNDVEGCMFKGSPMSRIISFIQRLKEHGYSAEYYKTNGSDINGACGQLRYYKKEEK